MSSAREAPFGRLGGRAFAKLVCTDSWRHGLLHRVIAAVIIAWVVQDIRAGRALSKEPADVRASVQTAYDDPSEDQIGPAGAPPFRGRVRRPSPTRCRPAGRCPRRRRGAILPAAAEQGRLRPPEPRADEVQRGHADARQLECPRLRAAVRRPASGVPRDGKTSAAYTFSMLGGGDVEQAACRIAWLKNEPGTRKNWFYGDWQGVNQSGALSMRIGPDAVELGNGQRLPILEETSTHIVVQEGRATGRRRPARLSTPRSTGTSARPNASSSACRSTSQGRPGESIPWDGIVAIGNATKDQSWWQDPAGDDPTLLFSIDASVRDQ
ncbi:unnamed protein product, partial [Prorocentrum cordatum]